MIKNVFFSLLCLASFTTLSAKIVRFSVDMTGQTVSPAGVHIMGDFQSEAGLGNDYAQLSPMTLEPGTNIYSIIVDIPAFRKYEYKFANGDLFYEVEFVPVESRVGYDFVDNRWIYVDSVQNDTTNTEAILYGGNAPDGLKLVRCLVDMSDAGSINPNGVYVSGSFANWQVNRHALYNFENQVYETIFYVAAGNYTYKYYNGNTSNETEIVPSACASNGERNLLVTEDIVLDPVCFSACTACLTTGISKTENPLSFSVYPNPASDNITIELNATDSYTISIHDINGKLVRSFINFSGEKLILNTQELTPGIYALQVSDAYTENTTKIIIQ